MFSEDQVAAIKGFCGVTDPKQIPHLWHTFQDTKHIATYRTELRTTMEHSERHNGGGGIDMAPFFSDALFGDLLALRFNPGEGVALYGSRQQGLTILCCRPKSAGEIEDIREHDEAMVATGGKMTYEEFRNKKKQGLAAALARPPETFLDLRLCINTFCAFLWALFGEQCEYYQSLMDVRDTLLLQEVSYMRDHFTPDICRRITWAVIDDGRAFFNQVMVKGHFDGSITRVRWPTSSLGLIVESVRFAQPIMRPNYPVEWSTKAQYTAPKGGTSGGQGSKGGGSGGAMGQRRSGGLGGNGGTGGEDRGGGKWVDPRHPKIATMMADYTRTKGSMRVKLSDILDGANKRITDLPKMALEAGGPLRPVCWAFVLGRCTFPSCRFESTGGHVTKEMITEDFADAVVAMLTPGVKYCVRNAAAPAAEGSPVKKQKMDEA